MHTLRHDSTVIGEWRVLSGPAILRISVLLLIAGALAALVQFLLPAAPPVPVPEPKAVERPAEPATPVPVLAEPAPAPRPAPAPPPQAAETPAGPARMPSEALAFPPAPAPSQAPPGKAEVARAEDAAGPRALAVVDLNTASVADLNRLQGGGAIGRAIVAKRPYASVDQLLTKRVLSRAVYDRVKDQVTVQ